MSTQSNELKEVVVAVSLGGTKLAVGWVDSSGPISTSLREADWRSEFKIAYGPQDQDNEPVRDEAEKSLIAGMADWMHRAFTEAMKVDHRVKKFGVATKGPLRRGDDSGGEFVAIGPCTTVPFKACKLDRELAGVLTKLGLK